MVTLVPVPCVAESDDYGAADNAQSHEGPEFHADREATHDVRQPKYEGCEQANADDVSEHIGGPNQITPLEYHCRSPTTI
jgi:hypothetical protein